MNLNNIRYYHGDHIRGDEVEEQRKTYGRSYKCVYLFNLQSSLGVDGVDMNQVHLDARLLVCSSSFVYF
jgi:hypothetical protein